MKDTQLNPLVRAVLALSPTVVALVPEFVLMLTRLALGEEHTEDVNVEDVMLKKDNDVSYALAWAAAKTVLRGREREGFASGISKASGKKLMQSADTYLKNPKSKQLVPGQITILRKLNVFQNVDARRTKVRINFRKTWNSGPNNHFEIVWEAGHEHALQAFHALAEDVRAKLDTADSVFSAIHADIKGKDVTFWLKLLRTFYKSELKDLRRMGIIPEDEKDAMTFIEKKIAVKVADFDQNSTVARPYVVAMAGAFTEAARKCVDEIIWPALQEKEEVPKSWVALKSLGADDAGEEEEGGGMTKPRVGRGQKMKSLEPLEEAYITAWQGSPYVKGYDTFKWGGGVKDVDTFMGQWYAGFDSRAVLT